MMRRIARILFRINIALAIVVVLLLLARNAQATPVITNKTPGVIKIMVIDTGIEPHEKLTPFVQYKTDNENYRDRHGHGTHVSGIIMFGNIDDNPKMIPSCDAVKIYSCKYIDPHTTLDPSLGDPQLPATILASNCIRRAILEGVDIINYSSGGYEYSSYEEDAVALAEKSGIVILAAAGNGDAQNGSPGFNIDGKLKYYPASLALTHNNVIPVGNMTRDAQRSPSSNYGMFGIMQWDMGVNIKSTGNYDNGFKYMTGTSQATPMYLYHYLKLNCNKIKQEKPNERSTSSRTGTRTLSLR